MCFFMTYEFEITATLERKLKKLQKKDKQLLLECRKKIYAIIQDPHHYKHLKYEDRYRVHVGGSFVLTYRVFENEKIIVFLDLAHHDDAYRH